MSRRPGPGGRAVIVGGGVFGATAALELSRRGWEVTLFDPGPLPHPEAASTDLSKMVRMDYGADHFYAERAEEALAGWDAWNAAWEWRPYHQDGFLLLSAQTMGPGGFEYESWKALSARGHPVERWGPELRAGLAHWSDTWKDGYLSRRAGWAESGRVVAELVRRSQDAGVRVRLERVIGLLEPDRGGPGVATDTGDRVRADVVVVAAGSWTPELLPWLADRLWPVRQPVFHLRVDDPAAFAPPRFPPWAGDMARSGWYGFPSTPKGIVKIANHGRGLPLEPGHEQAVGPEWEARLRAFLSQHLPVLSDAPVVSTRLCPYCDSFDGDFLIDRDPERPGLVVASGGSGHGFKFAPLLGGWIANVVEDRPDPALERFRWRARGAPRREHARADVAPGLDGPVTG